MPADTLPLHYNLTLYAGVTFRRRFRWKPDGTNPQDFTGWAGALRVGYQHSAASFTLTPENGGLTLGPDGLITIYIAADDTYDIDGGYLIYQLDLVPGSGEPIRFLRGRFIVLYDLAQP